jgi:hypothetical protein
MLHPNLPVLPERIAKLPVDERGFPVPWFVQWIDGKPDFRVIDSRKLVVAVNQRLCWVCGEPLGRHMAFTIGPMCAINRTSGEPPSHRECAVFSATACPFLTKPKVKRREEGKPEDVNFGANHIDRNPGVALVWVTKSYKPFPNSDGGVLFEVGDPEEVLFFAEGRRATQEEVMHSIDTGIPFLQSAALLDGADAEEELSRRYEETKQLVAANI